jgi:hypothetical protein
MVDYAEFKTVKTRASAPGFAVTVRTRAMP